MTYQTKSFAFEVKELSDAGEIEGYASVFGIEDKGGDTVERGAFSSAAGKSVPMLWNHDPGQPIGVWSQMSEDEYGLRVKGRLELEVLRAREIYALMKSRIIKGLSIGYNAKGFERVGNGRKLTEIILMEISPVTFAMLPAAQIDGVKSLDMDAMRNMTREEIEEALMRGAKPSRAVSRKFAGWAVEEITMRGAGDPSESDAQETLRMLQNFGR